MELWVGRHYTYSPITNSYGANLCVILRLINLLTAQRRNFPSLSSHILSSWRVCFSESCKDLSETSVMLQLTSAIVWTYYEFPLVFFTHQTPTTSFLSFFHAVNTMSVLWSRRHIVLSDSPVMLHQRLPPPPSPNNKKQLQAQKQVSKMG